MAMDCQMNSKPFILWFITVGLCLTSYCMSSRLMAFLVLPLWDDVAQPVGFNSSHVSLLQTFNSTHATLLQTNENIWRKNRDKYFDSWFTKGKKATLHPQADKDGAILDFAIIGFAKCGTTEMMAKLSKFAAMPLSDICTPVHQTVYYAYKNWPKQYDHNGTKILKGTKCPRAIDPDVSQFSTFLPRTKLIIGIRHPVLMYQSFWKMFARNQEAAFNPYDHTKIYGKTLCLGLCLGRARYHLYLAALGKTPLDTEERKFLAPGDYDGGKNLINKNISNPIFLYDITQISEKESSKLEIDLIWNDLAKFLQLPDKEKMTVSRESQNNDRTPKYHVDICDEKNDDLRALIMPYGYEMSIWLCDYLLVHVADDNNFIIPDPDRFCKIIRGYSKDPCGRLIRSDNGTYILGSTKV